MSSLPGFSLSHMGHSESMDRTYKVQTVYIYSTHTVLHIQYVCMNACFHVCLHVCLHVHMFIVICSMFI